MPKIIVVGSLNADVTVYADRLPLPGETVLGTSVGNGPGGKGGNQATAASRAGGEVVTVARLGRDSFGDMIAAHMEREGMTLRRVARGDEVTGTALIQVDSHGENTIIVVKGANDALSADDVTAAEPEFACADAVICQNETRNEPIIEAKRLAKKYGVPFIHNPAPYRELPEDFLEGIDWFTPNETEAARYCGLGEPDDPESAPEIAKRLLALGVKNVVITLGKSGSYYTDGERELVVPSFKVKAVDTVGAGDTYNGALAVAIAEKRPVGEALRFASAAAALSVTRKGAAASAPVRSEIDALAAAQG